MLRRVAANRADRSAPVVVHWRPSCASEWRRDAAGPVETTIAVKSEGTCKCRVDTASRHLACTPPNARSFEQLSQSG